MKRRGIGEGADEILAHEERRRVTSSSRERKKVRKREKKGEAPALIEVAAPKSRPLFGTRGGKKKEG